MTDGFRKQIQSAEVSAASLEHQLKCSMLIDKTNAQDTAGLLKGAVLWEKGSKPLGGSFMGKREMQIDQDECYIYKLTRRDMQ